MRQFVHATVGLLLCGLVSCTAFAVPANLAAFQTSSASSILNDDDFLFGPVNANNGDRSGFFDGLISDIWHSANTTVDPLWWEVDLQADYYLDRIQIFPRLELQALVKNFTIDVFNTANENVFSQSFLERRSTGDEPWATDAMRNVLGSRVRLTREPRHLAGYNDALTFAEFEVWGDTAPNLENLALDRPVTASTAMAGPIPTTADLANDGNLSGHFYHGSLYLSQSAGAGQFWQVDLESMNAISYVNVFARTDDLLQNGSIQISVLGADGTTVVDSATASLAGDVLGAQLYDLTQMFPSTPVGRYVRIETLDADKILALGEVQVFGVAAGSASTAVPEASTLGLVAAMLAVFSWMYRTRMKWPAIMAICASTGCFVGSARAVPTNVAPAGTASASSIYSAGFEAAMANNGNRLGDDTDIWHSTNTISDPLWWEVDLGGEFYLDRVQIFPRQLFQNLVKNFVIDVFDSTDANVFSQEFLPTKTTGDVPWGTSALRAVQGSRVRITREAPHLAGNDDAMTFGEFEVWGQSDPLPVNLALNRPVTASPELEIVGPTDGTLVNDGDISGHFWHESLYHSDPSMGAPFTGPYGNGHFWQVELAAPTAIDYVNVFARTDDVTQNGAIRISIVAADGTTIVDSADTTLGGEDLGAQRYDVTQLFPEKPIGTFVRIEQLETDKILVLGEVEVFGVADSPETPGDYNGDGSVDAADYVLWRDLLGSTVSLPNDSTPNVTAEDYSVWEQNFGAGGGAASGLATVPEPSSVALLAIGMLALYRASRCKRPLW